jgi:hypothetical protein
MRVLRGGTVTEAELLKRVIELADKHKILAFHSGDSRRDMGDRGFPDLCLAGSAGILFAELKDVFGVRSPGQIQWRYRLLSAGQHVALWRPRDLGDIESALEWLHEDAKMPLSLREAVYSRLASPRRVPMYRRNVGGERAATGEAAT